MYPCPNPFWKQRSICNVTYSQPKIVNSCQLRRFVAPAVNICFPTPDLALQFEVLLLISIWKPGVCCGCPQWHRYTRDCPTAVFCNTARQWNISFSLANIHNEQFNLYRFTKHGMPNSKPYPTRNHCTLYLTVWWRNFRESKSREYHLRGIPTSRRMC